MTDPEVIVVEVGADPAVVIVEIAGEQGPPGPPGSGGGAGSAQIFTQATPAATWVIPHGFGRRPLVAVYNAAGSDLLADVAATADAVTITFAQPTTGSAVLA